MFLAKNTGDVSFVTTQRDDGFDGLKLNKMCYFLVFFPPLQDFDDFIFAFFAIEMVIKMVALGIFGKKCYLGDTWNRLDFFIVVAG